MFWLHLCSEARLELGVVLGGMGPLGGQLPLLALVTDEVGDACAILGDFLSILFFIAMSLDVVEPSLLETLSSLLSFDLELLAASLVVALSTQILQRTPFSAVSKQGKLQADLRSSEQPFGGCKLVVLYLYFFGLTIVDEWQWVRGLKIILFVHQAKDLFCRGGYAK
jgi:hypothetical protein